MNHSNGAPKEWLESDGLGGFAMGATDLVPARRYHSILTLASNPPAVRSTMVNALEVWVAIEGKSLPLSSFLYAPRVLHPDGRPPSDFITDALWPTWRTELLPDVALIFELLMTKGAPLVSLSWRIESTREVQATLSVRPLVSGRSYHALQRHNPDCSLATRVREGYVFWRTSNQHPGLVAQSNGEFIAEPRWYYQFLYEHERERGYDCIEDLASPGVFVFPLTRSSPTAALIIAQADRGAPQLEGRSALQNSERFAASEFKRRALFATPLARAADHYLVRRGSHLTTIAGYPWFADWGRDTFVALRGLCIATGRLHEAIEVIECWIDTLSLGMLPNRFLDEGASGAAEYNSVDAALWFAVAVHETLEACEARSHPIREATRATMIEALRQILDHYQNGTRYHIHLDTDGLLAAGEPGLQLTWMDAKVGNYVVTPRIGKPVEVQALWINLLRIGERWLPERRDQLRALRVRAQESFTTSFWNSARGALYDVIDVNHRPGVKDARIRPNQLFAVAGLPFSLIDPERGRSIVDLAESTLLTPRGLRTLAPGEPGYVGSYGGDQSERDFAYHEGTAWPWLMGTFIEAWVKVRGDTPEAKREARTRFLNPLLNPLDQPGVGHISEVADGDQPHRADGCPFQAWSVAEALRIAALL